jgi:hypothetical protein
MLHPFFVGTPGFLKVELRLQKSDYTNKSYEEKWGISEPAKGSRVLDPIDHGKKL